MPTTTHPQPQKSPTAATLTEPIWLRKIEVARLLGVNPITIDRWITAGKFPGPVWVGPRTARWSRDLVLDWVCTRPAAHTGCV